MTSFAENAGSYNLALLSDAQRKAIESHKQECLARYKDVKATARLIYSGMKTHGRMWAERKIGERPDIEPDVRAELNAMMKGKK
jgi:hypothetical protein